MQSRLGLLSKTLSDTQKNIQNIILWQNDQFWLIDIYIYCRFCIHTSPCLLISLFPPEIGKETHRNSKNYNTKTVCTFPSNPAGSTVTTAEVILKVEAHHMTVFSPPPTPTRAFSFNTLAWLTLNSCNDSFSHTASVLFVNYSAPGINSEALSLWVYCGVMLVLSVSLLNTPNADKTGGASCSLESSQHCFVEWFMLPTFCPHAADRVGSV